MKKYKQKIGLIILILILGCFWNNSKTFAIPERGRNQCGAFENSAVSADVISDNDNLVAANANANGKTKVAQTADEANKQKIINRYLAGVSKVVGGEEYKEARIVVYGDIDGDGTGGDAAVQFTLEGMGGGNYYAFYLAVFRNENGNLKPLTDSAVGGKLSRAVTLKQIKDKKIYLDTKGYAENDGACCPSIKGQTVYILKNRKLLEVKAKGKVKE